MLIVNNLHAMWESTVEPVAFVELQALKDSFLSKR